MAGAFGSRLVENRSVIDRTPITAWVLKEWDSILKKPIPKNSPERFNALVKLIYRIAPFDAEKLLFRLQNPALSDDVNFMQNLRTRITPSKIGEVIIPLLQKKANYLLDSIDEYLIRVQESKGGITGYNDEQEARRLMNSEQQQQLSVEIPKPGRTDFDYLSGNHFKSSKTDNISEIDEQLQEINSFQNFIDKLSDTGLKKLLRHFEVNKQFLLLNADQKSYLFYSVIRKLVDEYYTESDAVTLLVALFTEDKTDDIIRVRKYFQILSDLHKNLIVDKLIELSGNIVLDRITKEIYDELPEKNSRYVDLSIAERIDNLTKREKSSPLNFGLTLQIKLLRIVQNQRRADKNRLPQKINSIDDLIFLLDEAFRENLRYEKPNASKAAKLLRQVVEWSLYTSNVRKVKDNWGSSEIGLFFGIVEKTLYANRMHEITKKTKPLFDSYWKQIVRLSATVLEKLAAIIGEIPMEGSLYEKDLTMWRRYQKVSTVIILSIVLLPVASKAVILIGGRLILVNGLVRTMGQYGSSVVATYGVSTAAVGVVSKDIYLFYLSNAIVINTSVLIGTDIVADLPPGGSPTDSLPDLGSLIRVGSEVKSVIIGIKSEGKLYSSTCDVVGASDNTLKFKIAALELIDENTFKARFGEKGNRVILGNAKARSISSGNLLNESSNRGVQHTSVNNKSATPNTNDIPGDLPTQEPALPLKNRNSNSNQGRKPQGKYKPPKKSKAQTQELRGLSDDLKNLDWYRRINKGLFKEVDDLLSTINESTDITRDLTRIRNARNKLFEIIGEECSIVMVGNHFGKFAGIKPIKLPLRGKHGPPILDLLFFNKSTGEFLVIEVKGGKFTKTGKSKPRKFSLNDKRKLEGIVDENLENIIQGSPDWLLHRMLELSKRDPKRAKELFFAAKKGKVKMIVTNIDPATGLVHKASGIYERYIMDYFLKKEYKKHYENADFSIDQYFENL